MQESKAQTRPQWKSFSAKAPQQKMSGSLEAYACKTSINPVKATGGKVWWTQRTISMESSMAVHAARIRDFTTTGRILR